MTPLLALNAALNGHDDGRAAGAAAAATTTVDVCALNWGEPELPRALRGDTGAPPPPSLIVLSDVVYDPCGYEPLLTSLVALVDAHLRFRRARRAAGAAGASDGGGGGGDDDDDGSPDEPGDDTVQIVMAHRHRNPDDHKFFASASQQFEIFELLRRDEPSHEPPPPGGGAAAEEDGDEDGSGCWRVVPFEQTPPRAPRGCEPAALAAQPQPSHSLARPRDEDSRACGDVRVLLFRRRSPDSA